MNNEKHTLLITLTVAHIHSSVKYTFYNLHLVVSYFYMTKENNYNESKHEYKKVFFILGLYQLFGTALIL